MHFILQTPGGVGGKFRVWWVIIAGVRCGSYAGHTESYAGVYHP